jgi:small subunit ribosomal protein S3
MGQKTHPIGIRLGIVKDWDSNWFALGKYSENVLEDFKIKQHLRNELKRAGIAKMLISRKAGAIEVKIYVARPGVVMGKGAADIKYISDELKKEIGKNIIIEVLEERNPDNNAKLLSEWIVFQLEKRVPFRRAMKMAVQKALRAGSQGIRVACAGRLGGVEIARCEWYREGRVPLQTFRADIDFAFSEALTTYGKIGVKLWLYNGEIFKNKKEAPIEIGMIKSKEAKKA